VSEDLGPSSRDAVWLRGMENVAMRDPLATAIADCQTK
jgi:hypothetical protein